MLYVLEKARRSSKRIQREAACQNCRTILRRHGWRRTPACPRMGGGIMTILTRCDFGQGAPRHQYLVGRRFTKSSALHPIRSAKQNKHVIITCNPRGRGDEIFISSLDASKVVVTCSGTRGPRCAGSVLRSVLRFSLHLIQHL